MKQMFALLFLIAAVTAFQVNTITNFPATMYGGGSYSASYHVDGAAIYPIYAAVNVTDGMSVRDCPNNVCNITGPDFNITVDLVPNIMPEVYNITVQFSANYTVPDPAGASYSSGSSNGGGSVSGGSGPTGSNSETGSFNGQPFGFRRSLSGRTITFSFVNNGDSDMGPFVLMEEIPYDLNPEDVEFSLQPSSFEHGSLIAVWNFNGLAPGNSISISYTLNRNVGSLSAFKLSVKEPAPVVPTKPPVIVPETKPEVTPEVKPPATKPTTPVVIPAELIPSPAASALYDDQLRIGGAIFLIGIVAALVYFAFGREPKAPEIKNEGEQNGSEPNPDRKGND